MGQEEEMRKETLYRVGQGLEALCTFFTGPHSGLRSCTLSTLRPWGSQSCSSNFAYIQTYLCSWHPHALKWTGEGVIIIKLSRRLAHAWGAGSIPSLKYAGYVGVDTAILMPASVNYSWGVQPLVSQSLPASKDKLYFIPSWEYSTKKTKENWQ